MEISSSPRGNLILELSQCAPRWLKCHFHPPQSAPPPLHRSIFNHHPLQPTWLFLFRFLISLQIWAAIPHLARGCVLCSTISPFSFFCPSIFLPHQSFLLFFLRLLLPKKWNVFLPHLGSNISFSDKIVLHNDVQQPYCPIFDTLPLWFPSETRLNHNVGWQDGALAVALNYGEGETMFVSGRIYINLGTCEIWGHLFALLKNLKHEQHKSPTGCWQCFTKQSLTWSLESDLMKLLFCNFVYMRCQWSFADSFLY